MNGRHQRLFEKKWSALIKDAGRSTFPLSASCSHIRSFFIWKKTLVLIIKKTIYMWTRTLRASTVASIGTDWLVCLGFIRDADNDTHTHTEHLTTQFLIKKRGRTNQWAWTDHVSISAYDDGWDDGLLTAVSLRRSLRCPRFLSEALQLSVEAWWAPEDEPARFRSLAHQMKTCNLPVI